MQSALDFLFIYLDMVRSTTAGYLTHSALEVRHVETATPVSQLQVQLPVDAIEQFPEDHDIMEQSNFQVAHGNVPNDSSENGEAEDYSTPMLAY